VILDDPLGVLALLQSSREPLLVLPELVDSIRQEGLEMGLGTTCFDGWSSWLNRVKMLEMLRNPSTADGNTSNERV
jgi:hypothetical protein